MQHLDDGQWSEEGCFVYQVLCEDGLGVRTTISVGDEARLPNHHGFKKHELVSIDLVFPSRVPGSKNGPFLRLSDHTGWLFERKYGDQMMKRIPVKTGLWAFYVDNYFAGQALRHHPVDRAWANVDRVSYVPMQKIYCDRKVTHPVTGVNFYRVQGTEGWVFDKRPSDSGDPRFMLLDESQVKIGLFSYRALFSLAIRCNTNTNESSKTSQSIKKGDIIVANAVRECPRKKGDGPFLRLTDGFSWLFEKKKSEKVMEEIPIESGLWTFKVLNAPAGIKLRRQPIDNDMQYERLFAPDEVVKCDKKICSPSGVNFYRVKDTNGWIFDKRANENMLELVSARPEKAQVEEEASGSGWTPDFVRGVAAAVDGLKEISFNQASRLISFQSSDGARINVYHTTQTVGTAMDHANQGKTQLFRRNCSSSELVEIMKNPRIHTGKGYQRKRARIEHPTIVQSSLGPGIIVEQEEELRNRLLECDDELKKVQKKRLNLLKSIKILDDMRAEAAEKTKKEMTKRREQEEEQRRKLTCNECNRLFSSTSALRQHRRDAHMFLCEICDRVFRTHGALNQHRNSLDH